MYVGVWALAMVARLLWEFAHAKCVNLPIRQRTMREVSHNVLGEFLRAQVSLFICTYNVHIFQIYFELVQKTPYKLFRLQNFGFGKSISVAMKSF